MGQAPAVVFGQGALGTLFAVLLAREGDPVHVVSSRAKEDHRVTLRVRGRRELEAEVQLAPSPPDEDAWVAVLAGRAARAFEQAPLAADVVGSEGAIAPVQNGLVPLEIVAQTDAHASPVVVGLNAHLREPRTVELTSRGGVTVGGLSPTGDEVAQRLTTTLRGPIPADRTDNVRGAVWSKWCISCAINGLAVVRGAGVDVLTGERAGREALVGVVTECVELARAKGVELERVAGPLSPATLAGNATSGVGGWFRRAVVWLIGRGYGDVEPSSVGALREGRDPELDALSQRAVELGDEHGVQTPWNAAVATVAGAIVDGDREPGQAALEDVNRLARGKHRP